MCIRDSCCCCYYYYYYYYYYYAWYKVECVSTVDWNILRFISVKKPLLMSTYVTLKWWCLQLFFGHFHSLLLTVSKNVRTVLIRQPAFGTVLKHLTDSAANSIEYGNKFSRFTEFVLLFSSLSLSQFVCVCGGCLFSILNAVETFYCIRHLSLV